MSGFSTTPAELYAASSSLGAAGSELVGGRAGGIGGGTGAGALDAALSQAAARAALTAKLLSAAATVSARNLAAAAEAYEVTDSGAMPPGRV
jgi:hypothetical protein